MCDDYTDPTPTDDEFTNGRNAWNAQAEHVKAHGVQPDELMLVSDVMHALNVFANMCQMVPQTDEGRAEVLELARDTVLPYLKGMIAAFDDMTVEDAAASIPDEVPQSWL